MVSLADIHDVTFEPPAKGQADKDSLKIVGLICIEAHLRNACFNFTRAAEVLEEGFDEAGLISDPEIQISAIHILAETYNDAREEYRSVGLDMG
jgi:hypothetical protein